MGYYMGDFYRGAMYRGDPGFFGFLGGLAKKAVGFIPGVGPALSAGLSAIPSGGKGIIKAVPKLPGPAMSAGREILAKGGRVIAKHPVLSAAGAAGAAGAVAGVAAGRLMHPGLHGRRHRRMNVCNPRALRRAIRRTHGFARLAMKTIHLVHPKKHVTFGGFKHRRKKK